MVQGEPWGLQYCDVMQIGFSLMRQSRLLKYTETESNSCRGQVLRDERFLPRGNVDGFDKLERPFRRNWTPGFLCL